MAEDDPEDLNGELVHRSVVIDRASHDREAVRDYVIEVLELKTTRVSIVSRVRTARGRTAPSL